MKLKRPRINEQIYKRMNSYKELKNAGRDRGIQ
jgi:hypothetical protein